MACGNLYRKANRSFSVTQIVKEMVCMGYRKHPKARNSHTSPHFSHVFKQPWEQNSLFTLCLEVRQTLVELWCIRGLIDATGLLLWETEKPQLPPLHCIRLLYFKPKLGTFWQESRGFERGFVFLLLAWPSRNTNDWYHKLQKPQHIMTPNNPLLF